MKRALFLLLALSLLSAGSPQNPRFDLVIQGGSIVDGTGAPAFTADLGVRDGRIAAIGDLTGAAAGTVIDAAERVVTPGFIDAHAHGDPRRTPDFPNEVAMGVTTLLLGQDGSSSVDPDDPDTWFRRNASLATGPNVAYLAGHAGIRRCAGVPMGSAAEGARLQGMESAMDTLMTAGCFGLSTGLEYRPGTFASRAELAAIARPVGRHGGVVMSHVRDEDNAGIEGSLQELLDQGRDGDTAVHVSHIKVVYGKGPRRAEEVLALLDDARRESVRVTADIYPYTASYTGIAILFP
ncbi:MAG: N-acyl-D-amino acid deacylase, partial [bacterium]